MRPELTRSEWRSWRTMSSEIDILPIADSNEETMLRSQLLSLLYQAVFGVSSGLDFGLVLVMVLVLPTCSGD